MARPTATDPPTATGLRAAMLTAGRRHPLSAARSMPGTGAGIGTTATTGNKSLNFRGLRLAHLLRCALPHGAQAPAWPSSGKDQGENLADITQSGALRLKPCLRVRLRGRNRLPELACTMSVATIVLLLGVSFLARRTATAASLRTHSIRN
jgi:hypothetical protein